MAIVFSEQKKRQQYLILVFTIVILATAIVFWFGVFKKPIETPPSSSLPIRKIEINFQVFDQSLLSELELFEEVPAFEGVLGRNNPFLPYLLQEEPIK
ncbi:MAG: hypothetical protein A2117_00625 [Candidatus Wildermuthbacteria bacterium GWA2_46_15]|uniref:Uncharacterized protein n=1 Tax=Candidatus Wildermuthbacteria bacterium GWA2_46_15 TaxID=1802443 RepID=A0A1G2QNR1_9BACT|nr:MAG: hypothetical protein A2117_00625 [Candidatus Wildermuthbacteria bacterium GWA2_46_15]